MFGYIIGNINTLSAEERMRLRALYCGMCRTLRKHNGNLTRLTLSYDMTFVALVLAALYEPDEQSGLESCASHPFKPHNYTVNSIMEYAADINVMLAYHKCADNWLDDRNPAFWAAQGALGRAYRKACKRWPAKAKAIETWMRDIRKIEAAGREEIDPPVNLTGKMMGEIFRYREDYWADTLQRMGDALGRFIYFMDAYDDLAQDVRKKKFNPLKSMMHEPDFEEVCKQALTMMMADCAEAFEELPVLKDAEMIRNILYSGVWAKYLYIQSQKTKGKGAG